jgi:hypothetical protein
LYIISVSNFREILALGQRQMNKCVCTLDVVVVVFLVFLSIKINNKNCRSVGEQSIGHEEVVRCLHLITAAGTV